MPTLQEVDAYEVPGMLTPRVAKEHGHSEELAAKLVKEAKRMLYLSASEGVVVSPSEVVDHAWHEMMLFTRYYQQYADFIGKFIHHDPTPGPPDGGNTYRNTKAKYEEVFGEKPDPECWP